MKKYNYKGNSHPFAMVLCHSGDIPAVLPVLDAMSDTGLRLCLMDEKTFSAKKAKKACSVIVFMTESFYASDVLCNAYILLGGLNMETVSVRADDAPTPEVLANFGYSKNSVKLSKYETAEAAEKLLSSDALKEPKVTAAQSAAYKRTLAGMICAGVAAAAALAVGIAALVRKEPAMAELPDMSRYGIYAEDIAKIRTVTLIGDRVEHSEYDESVWSYLVESWDDEGERVWVSMENGKEAETGGLADLSFLTLLPNLRSVNLINQTGNELPDFSQLQFLESVEIWDCDYDSIEALRDCERLTFVHLSLDALTDLSPLTSCPELRDVDITDCDSLRTLEGFSPGLLRSLQLHCDNLTDISAIAGCQYLSEVEFFVRELADISPLGECKRLNKAQIGYYDTCPVSDFSSLAGCDDMQYLILLADRSIDISFVSGMSALKDIDLCCTYVSGTEALAQCENLERLKINLGEHIEYIDTSGLSGLAKLDHIELYNCNCSLDFLGGACGEDGYVDYIELVGSSVDWSGLANVKKYGNLYMSTSGTNCSLLLESLQDAEIHELHLNYCGGVDVTKIPANVKLLKLDNCNVTSIDGLACTELSELQLGNCSRITDLAGVEKLEKLEAFRAWNCPHLTDWSALNGMTLHMLDLHLMYTFPDMSQVNMLPYGYVVLNNNETLTDLSLLDGISDEIAQSGQFTVEICTDELVNLNALLRFKGNKLTVSPNLEEQAADLVDRGCFKSYEIQYSDSAWNTADDTLELLSLDELDTLPKALLSHVSDVFIVGDTVYDSSFNIVIEGSRKDDLSYYIENRGTDERIEIEPGDYSFDLSRLSELNELRTLRIACTKLDSLEGIQSFQNLTCLELIDCGVTDISPVFAIDSLERLRIAGDIDSLQGIQNLHALHELDLQNAGIGDLSALGELSLDGALCLELPNTWMVSSYPKDLSVLAAVPEYEELYINSYKNVEWIPYLSGKSISRGAFLSVFKSNEEFESLMNSLGAVDTLCIPYNERVTDLSCLIGREGLQRVEVSANMAQAIASLDGKDYGFELVIHD